mgnify:CR=1 FL=1
MEIYLDANATTPVLPAAQAAALACMSERFGNPSSTHATGLRAHALLDDTRARARRVLGAPTGQLLFTSGATEGIQTAVLSALISLRGRDDVDCLLYGATEHKAVPAALHHWNRLLDLGLVVAPIPVDLQGRHDLDWLRRHAGRAGLVCTMAANNESGVISDLDGIEAALLDCANHGAGGAVIFASGYTETGVPERVAEQARITEIAHDTGIKVVGPDIEMRPLANGLGLPAGESREFKPRGYHVLLTGVTGPLPTGGRLALTLTFEKAGSIEVGCVVETPGPVGFAALRARS